jgi:hypothetical protein
MFRHTTQPLEPNSAARSPIRMLALVGSIGLGNPECGRAPVMVKVGVGENDLAPVGGIRGSSGVADQHPIRAEPSNKIKRDQLT